MKKHLWLSLVYFFPSIVAAAPSSDDTLTVVETGFNTAQGSNEVIHISDVVDGVITVILFIVGVAAIIYLIFSGFQYITSGGDDEKATNGRKGVINAIIGLIIVMAAWYILRAAAGLGGGIGSTNISDVL